MELARRHVHRIHLAEWNACVEANSHSPALNCLEESNEARSDRPISAKMEIGTRVPPPALSPQEFPDQPLSADMRKDVGTLTMFPPPDFSAESFETEEGDEIPAGWTLEQLVTVRKREETLP